jgi:tetratricopeptide (TPR) repeat protein
MKYQTLILFVLLSYSTISAQSTPDQLVKEGVILHDEEKYDEAIEKFEAAVKIDPKNYTAYYELSNTYFAKQDLKKTKYYAEKASKAEGETGALAYTMLGTVLDLDGKPKEAIKNYKKALKLQSGNYNIYLNMAVTYANMKEPVEAETAIIEAIKLKPEHPSSHYILGVLNVQQGRKTKALLALYHFLMLEPKTNRSKLALKMVNEIVFNSAQQNENGNNITLTMTDDNEEFVALDLVISMTNMVDKQVKDNLKLDKPITEATSLIKLNHTIFEYFSKSTEKKQDIWWDYYGKFYDMMEQKGHTETFTYYILQNKKDKEVDKWLEENKGKINDFKNWIGEYDFRIVSQ